MHLYIVRHGESFGNLPGYAGEDGWDVALTERGHAQAAAAAPWIAAHLPKPHFLYASTMRRAHQTAEYIAKALDMPIVLDDRIREIGNNFLDHTPVPPDGDAQYGNFWASERPFASITPNIENGESMMHFRARIGLFMEEIIQKHRQETLVIVCHGFVIDAFLDIAFNVGPYRNAEVWTSNSGIMHMQFIEHPGRERWRIHFVNRIEHLKGVGGLGITASGDPEGWQE